MKEKSQKKTQIDYPVVQFGKAFYKEMLKIHYNNTQGAHVFASKIAIWEYIPTTTLRLYWATIKTRIHKLVEIKWQAYVKKNRFYPNSSFGNYLLKERWGAQFSPDSVDVEIKIWLEIRNKVLP